MQKTFPNHAAEIADALAHREQADGHGDEWDFVSVAERRDLYCDRFGCAEVLREGYGIVDGDRLFCSRSCQGDDAHRTGE